MLNTIKSAKWLIVALCLIGSFAVTTVYSSGDSDASGGKSGDSDASEGKQASNPQSPAPKPKKKKVKSTKSADAGDK